MTVTSPSTRSTDWAGRFASLPVLQQVAAGIPAMPAAMQRMGQAVLAHPFRAATLNIDEFAGTHMCDEEPTALDIHCGVVESNGTTTERHLRYLSQR